MKNIMALLVIVLPIAAWAAGDSPDSSRDILVTFVNHGATSTASGAAPYKFRKRYALSSRARSSARDIAKEYDLQTVDDWPIKSLSVYCFVFRVPETAHRESVIAELQVDARVESAQILNQFETGLTTYDDTYAGLQHGLHQLDITAAHSYTRGEGVRIAVIDSHVDTQHEDLEGRISETYDYVDDRSSTDEYHGTAIVSVIGATANNARGMVGVAPEAKLDVHVACWLDARSGKSVCDSFSLAKALDAVASKPPEVLNMSLVGPQDVLLGRLIEKIHAQGTVIVAAAGSMSGTPPQFPASHKSVIGVHTSAHESGSDNDESPAQEETGAVFAPGWQIMVAVPNGGYDFRSGTSISAAHVSGVVALVLSVSPEISAEAIQILLQRSQARPAVQTVSVDACRALQLVDDSKVCSDDSKISIHSKLKPDA